MKANCKVAYRCLAAALLSAAALALGGCGGGGGGSFHPEDYFSGLIPSTNSGGVSTVFEGAAEAPAAHPVTAADLVGPDGQCAGTPNAAVQRVSLTMTECEMVAVSGPPDQIEAGSGDVAQRRTVMTYTKGDHAGIYTFVSGRLKIMDELPGPAKPEPRKRVIKKPPPKRPHVRKPPARKPPASPPRVSTPAPIAPATPPAQ